MPNPHNTVRVLNALRSKSSLSSSSLKNVVNQRLYSSFNGKPLLIEAKGGISRSFVPPPSSCVHKFCGNLEDVGRQWERRWFSASAEENVEKAALNSEKGGRNEGDDAGEKLSEIARITEESRIATEKVKELQDKLLRSLAEQENARKRHLKELSNTEDYAVSNFAKGVLDVADNLSLATKAVDDKSLESNPELKQIFDGVKMTEAVLYKVLSKFGVEKYDPLNEKFDPVYHEALFEMQDPTKEKGVIAQVVQSGYTIQNRVLRAAKVGVVRN